VCLGFFFYQDVVCSLFLGGVIGGLYLVLMLVVYLLSMRFFEYIYLMYKTCETFIFG